MRRRPVPRYDDHQIDVAVLVRLTPGVRAEEVDRLGVELFDEAPNDLLEHAGGKGRHGFIVPHLPRYGRSLATTRSSSAKPSDLKSVISPAARRPARPITTSAISPLTAPHDQLRAAAWIRAPASALAAARLSTKGIRQG